MAFKVGDRVSVTCTSFSLKDEIGTVVGLYGTNFYQIDFDNEVPDGHNCSGKARPNHGRCIHQSDINLIKEEEVKMQKFGVGDKVMIKFVADMLADDCLDPDSQSINRDGYTMSIGFRSAHFGKIATVEKEYEYQGRNRVCDLIAENGTRIPMNFPEWALCLVEKAKPIPAKKKITVAEIEKLVGYGVEIVKG